MSISEKVRNWFGGEAQPERPKQPELTAHERRDLLRRQRSAEAILRAIKKDGRVWFPPGRNDRW